jgi:anti-sigma regulatory factor (Ser/Thr protein kinase)
MALIAPVRLRVDDRSGVAPARRAAEQLADDLGFDETRRGQVAIVVTELATNLVRHGGGGEIVLRVGRSERPTVDAIAIDRGPGMRDARRAFEDGYSTGGGPGNGLGAIERLAATLDVQSTGGQGTVVAARLGAEAEIPSVDGIALPMAGEEASGDAWAQASDGAMLTLMLVDGLGHGADAAVAAQTAVRELRAGVDPGFLLERIHGALASTRGAAAAVARVDRASGRVDYAGIGNIAGTIVAGGQTKSLVSMPGILGHRTQRVRSFQYELPPGGLLVLHSDGLRSGWELAGYPGLLLRDPLVIASLLIRDFERGRDDVSVAVARRER